MLARTAIRISNSTIEAWWRVLKRARLLLHPLDSVAEAPRLVAFHVAEHGARVPHAPFHGRTADEIHVGTGEGVPDRLSDTRQAAGEARLAASR